MPTMSQFSILIYVFIKYFLKILHFIAIRHYMADIFSVNNLYLFRTESFANIMMSILGYNLCNDVLYVMLYIAQVYTQLIKNTPKLVFEGIN